MMEEKWTDLEKGFCPNHYNFKVKSAYGGCHCPSTINFSQCAFDNNDEALVVIDNNGIAYYIDLTGTPAYKKLGCVGISTFLAFNPTDRGELLIGLSSTNIKVLRINAINDFCLLTGHTASPINISFYKEYCLTASSKEAIVWIKKSYCKAHQLKLNTKNVIVKKAIFSNLGLVSVLYQTNVIQSWTFQQFHKDNRIEVSNYGIKTVKDFEFTTDGRAMIVCGLENKILIFNTTTWDVIKDVSFHENFSGGRQISVISLPLDGGANSVVAVLTNESTLKLINLASCTIIDNCCDLEVGLKRMEISHKGHYLASINKYGVLDILYLNKLFNVKLSCNSEKPKEQKKSSHKAEDHLKCVRNTVKEELKLKRLLPILKEFGEYPEKHRKLIWSTIMELPDNTKAYVDLSSNSQYELALDMLKNNPLLDKFKSSLLGTTLSCLLHWSPILKECSFLPKLIMPFVNFFQKNPVIGFEAVLYIMLNYCQKWFEYHPLPPLNILGMIENILLEADPLLFNYFCEQGLTSTEYAWPLLQTTMSEVLSENDWLILWDHILSIQKPWYLLMCSVAYNILYRKVIMTKLKTSEDIKQFYKTQGHVSIKNILKIAHKLDNETPHRLHPLRYLRNEICTIPKTGPYLPFLQYEFPKYLTDELRGLNLKKLKEKEKRLRGFQLHAMELLEEKRLQAETERFVKYIHEMRLNELRKCYENQVQEDKRLLEYTKKETEDLDPCKNLDDDISWSDSYYRKLASAQDVERKKRKNKHKNCKLLQEQVDRLEFEVQHLLKTLHNNSSRIRLKK